MDSARQYWLILGSREERTIFLSRLPSKTSKTEIARLLQKLAARHLSEEEIVDASRVKKSASYSCRLEVGRTGRDECMFVEGVTRYTARICSAFEYSEAANTTPRFDLSATSMP